MIFRISILNALTFIFLSLVGIQISLAQINDPVDYVFTLMGTDSESGLSNGNTYPAVAVPWGMNLWTPQTGPMGHGWAYTYNDNKIRGFKQTH